MTAGSHSQQGSHDSGATSCKWLNIEWYPHKLRSTFALTSTYLTNITNLTHDPTPTNLTSDLCCAQRSIALGHARERRRKIRPSLLGEWCRTEPRAPGDLVPGCIGEHLGFVSASSHLGTISAESRHSPGTIPAQTWRIFGANSASFQHQLLSTSFSSRVCRRRRKVRSCCSVVIARNHLMYLSMASVCCSVAPREALLRHGCAMSVGIACCCRSCRIASA